MTTTDGFRIWFLVLYTIGIVVFVIEVIRYRSNQVGVEKQVGQVPAMGTIIVLAPPPILLLLRLGEILNEWIPIRVIGLVVGLYGIVMWVWAAWVLGRLYVPGIGVFSDHTLVTSGPFRFVRHPIYAGVITLWLGTALGTLNLLLLVLWFGLAYIMNGRTSAEETLLKEKFGASYETYMQQTGRYFPKIGGRKQATAS